MSTTTNPTFTLAGGSHIDLLIQMMQEFYRCEHLDFDERSARTALAQLLRDEGFGRIYLIRLDEESIGYAVLTFGFSLEFHGRYALLDEFYIREKHRGQGIGKATLEFLEEICRQSGVKALRLEVDRTNSYAQQLYRKAGFEEHDRYLMTRWL